MPHSGVQPLVHVRLEFDHEKKVEYSPQLLKPAIIVGHDQDVDSLKGSMLLLEGGKRNEKT